jgi:small subunit ribosomal protein S16
VGAQPTETARTILSNEGVLLMHHLLGGVKKGAFDQAEAERRFNEWKNRRDAKVNSLKVSMATKSEENAKARMEAEAAKNKAIAEAVAKKKADLAAAAAAQAAEATAEENAQEAAAE